MTKLCGASFSCHVIGIRRKEFSRLLRTTEIYEYFWENIDEKYQTASPSSSFFSFVFNQFRFPPSSLSSSSLSFPSLVFIYNIKSTWWWSHYNTGGHFLSPEILSNNLSTSLDNEDEDFMRSHSQKKTLAPSILCTFLRG